MNSSQEFPRSFLAIRSGTGWRHSRGEAGSKLVQFVQVCKSEPQPAQRAAGDIASATVAEAPQRAQRNADSVGAPSPRPRGASRGSRGGRGGGDPDALRSPSPSMYPRCLYFRSDMPAVYRRPTCPALRVVGFALAIALTGCRDRPAEPPPSSARATTAATPAGDFLATYGVASAALSSDGSLALLEREDGSLDLVRRDPLRRERLELRGTPLGFEPARHAALILAAGGARPFLWRPATGATSSLAVPPTLRFLAWTGDSGIFLAAGDLAGAGRDDVYQVTAPHGLPRLLATNPTPFRIAAATHDGARMALLRTVHPESDEVYLWERAGGETRLMLPREQEGRYRPLSFADDGRSLLLAFDATGAGRGLSRLDLATGRLSRLPLPECDVVALAPDRQVRQALLSLSCDGLVEGHWLDLANGRELTLPKAPAGTWWVGGVPSDSGALLLVAAGPRSARDAYSWSGAPDAELLPLTWTLGPALDPAALVAPERLRLGAGPTDPPAELWVPPRPADGCPALVWIESDARPAAWMEFHPLFALLAQRGATVLRLRPRGGEGFGAVLRHAADGRPATAPLEDLEAARRLLAARCPGGSARIALAGEGALAGSLVAAALADRPDRWTGGVILDPDPDPLRVVDELAALPVDARTWWTTRLGDPADPRLADERQRLRPLEQPLRLPLLLLSDPSRGEAVELAAALEARALAGEPLELRADARSPGGFRALARPAREAVFAHVTRLLELGSSPR